MPAFPIIPTPATPTTSYPLRAAAAAVRTAGPTAAAAATQLARRWWTTTTTMTTEWDDCTTTITTTISNSYPYTPSHHSSSTTTTPWPTSSPETSPGCGSGGTCAVWPGPSWVQLIYGVVPDESGDMVASVIFLLLYLALLAALAWRFTRKLLAVQIALLILAFFLVLRLATFAARAYLANNDPTTGGIVVEQVFLQAATPFLLEVYLYLFTVRAPKFSPMAMLGLRIVNAGAFAFYIGGSAALAVFLNQNTPSSSSGAGVNDGRPDQAAPLLPLAASLIEMGVILVAMFFTLMARSVHKIPTMALAILEGGLALLLIHFIWCIWAGAVAETAWTAAGHPGGELSQYQGVYMTWDSLKGIGRSPPESAVTFWILFVVTEFLAAALLLAFDLAPIFIPGRAEELKKKAEEEKKKKEEEKKKKEAEEKKKKEEEAKKKGAYEKVPTSDGVDDALAGIVARYGGGGGPWWCVPGSGYRCCPGSGPCKCGGGAPLAPAGGGGGKKAEFLVTVNY